MLPSTRNWPFRLPASGGPCQLPPAHQPAPGDTQGNATRQLAGVVVVVWGGGGWSCTSAATRGQRALLRFYNSSGEEKTRGAQACLPALRRRACLLATTCARMAMLRSCGRWPLSSAPLLLAPWPSAPWHLSLGSATRSRAPNGAQINQHRAGYRSPDFQKFVRLSLSFRQSGGLEHMSAGRCEVAVASPSYALGASGVPQCQSGP
jgi:hypothetical protein